MQYNYMSAGEPAPGGQPGKTPGPEITPPPSPQGPPPQPGPEITPPAPPQGPPEKTPDEIPDHDIKRSPPSPKAEEERAELIAEQDREDVQERSPYVFPDPTLMESGDTYDQEDSKVIPEE